MTLLQERDAERHRRRADLFDATRADLRAALSELIPGEKVILFGSLTKRGIFNDASDVDLALEGELLSLSTAELMAELSERLHRRVDILFLGGCRFREKIQREGEVWTT